VGTNDVPTLRDLLGDLGVLARVCFRVGMKNPATRSMLGFISFSANLRPLRSIEVNFDHLTLIPVE
ncbi:MAG TPA: hypothetical protein VJN91_00870, partial [Gammaproteobacteria bacterium]|nr:hypothetical protein [Gammaproteobacteria bacterium]